MTQFRVIPDSEMETGIDTPASATFVALKDNPRAIAESDPSVPLAFRVNLDLAHTGPGAPAGSFLVVSKSGSQWKKPDLADRLLVYEFTQNTAWVVPVSGIYRMRIWGGAGAGTEFTFPISGNMNCPGSVGGYIEAYAQLTAGQVLEIEVGAGAPAVFAANVFGTTAGYSRIVIPFVFELRAGGGQSFAKYGDASPVGSDENIITGSGFTVVHDQPGGIYAFAGYGSQPGHILGQAGTAGRVIIERF